MQEYIPLVLLKKYLKPSNDKVITVDLMDRAPTNALTSNHKETFILTQ